MKGRTIGHYRIVALLGQGGMGAVYRAEDTVLKREIALKVLPAELTRDAQALRRFQREAEAVAALNHPNIVMLHSIDEHDGVRFLTMELVEGQRLDEILPEGGFELSRFLELAIPIADALSAAHAKGITHRDLKPANVMVSNDGVVKILDFGLAKAATAERPAEDTLVSTLMLTQPGHIIGTVPYMSPEQLAGGVVDARSDIFSLGVVYYEMATGSRPFQGKSSPLLMSAILKDTPAALTECRADLPRQLDRIVRNCLEKNPKNRFQSALDVRNFLRSLRQETETGLYTATQARPSRLRAPGARRWLAAAGAALVVALAAWMLVGRDAATDRTAGGTAVAPVAASRPAVAVLGFKNLGPVEGAWLSTALAELFSTDLAATGEVRTVPGESVARMRRELDLPSSETLAPDTLQAIRHHVGSEYVLLGSFLAVPSDRGNEVSLMLRLQSTADGTALLSVRETGRQEELFELVSRASAKLRSSLDLSAITEAQAGAVRATLPDNTEAARYYADGLTKLREYSVVEARDLLLEAVRLDPEYALAHAALGRAHLLLGNDSAAVASSAEALRLAENLSSRQVLLIRGQQFEAAGDWQKAAETYRVLWRRYGDEVEHGLRLVRALTESGQREEALSTVLALRKLPPPDGDDPRIALQEAYAARWFFDPERSLTAAREAIAEGEARGSWILAAEGHRLAAMALEQLDRPSEAAAEFEAGREGFTQAEDWGNVGRIQIGLGVLEYNAGRLNEAEKLFRQGLAITEESGYRTEVGWATNNLALVTYQLGDLAAGKRRFEEALTIAEETGNRNLERNANGHLSDLLLDAGDLAEAERRARVSLDIANAIEERDGAGWAWQRLGAIAHQAGDLPAAREHFARALEVARELDFGELLYSTMEAQAALAIAAGDLDGAGKLLSEALRQRRQSGKALPAETRFVQAIYELERGDLEPAAEVAEGLSAELRREGRRNFLARSVALQAQIALRRGEPAAARALERELSAIRLDREARRAALETDITLASLEALAADRAGALRRVEAAQSEAARLGLREIELRASLARGQIERAAGMQGGRARLAALAEEAAAGGFGLIAAHAAAATG